MRVAPRPKILALTPKRFNAALAHLNLDHKEAANFLGADERTIRKYAAGERAIPHPTELLLLVMVAGVITPTRVKEIHDSRYHVLRVD